MFTLTPEFIAEKAESSKPPMITFSKSMITINPAAAKLLALKLNDAFQLDVDDSGRIYIRNSTAVLKLPI
jgi:hypothetical protein